MWHNRYRNIAVVAPAGASTRDKVEAGVRYLEAHGKNVRVMPHVFAGASRPYLAAEAEARAADLSSAWLDPGIDLILAVRGGFGSAHILPLLDWEKLRTRKIPVVGYSDITALHFAMLRKRAGIAIAAPMAAKLPEAMADAYTAQEMEVAFARSRTRTLAMPEQRQLRMLRPGRLRAKVIAANLAVAATLCGTPYLPRTRGRLVILEDLNEAPYKVDRYLTQLAQSGFFEGCAGIAFGSFLDCGEAAELDPVLRQALDWTAGPVATGFPFGHEFPMISLNFEQFIEFGGGL